MLTDTAMRQVQHGGFAQQPETLPVGSGALQRLRQASAFAYETRQMAEDLAGRLLGYAVGPEVKDSPPQGVSDAREKVAYPFVSDLHEVAERIEQQQARTLAALRPLLDAFA